MAPRVGAGLYFDGAAEMGATNLGEIRCMDNAAPATGAVVAKPICGPDHDNACCHVVVRMYDYLARNFF